LKLLLDTHIAIWAATNPGRLSGEARASIENLENELFFSAASIWEVAIKRISSRGESLPDHRMLRRNLLENDYRELSITSEHAVAIDTLPGIHKDPFDRILIAQAIVEALTFVTADRTVAKYPGSILFSPRQETR
jgi:PIN domain nuclease of toxin-antitoxin system